MYITICSHIRHIFILSMCVYVCLCVIKALVCSTSVKRAQEEQYVCTHIQNEKLSACIQSSRSTRHTHTVCVYVYAIMMHTTTDIHTGDVCMNVHIYNV
ncbi:hypothetical protein EON63_24510 [archaeon]|nr:MAG: hypothetical protein EON63_24510 [archaeon]